MTVIKVTRKYRIMIILRSLTILALPYMASTERLHYRTLCLDGYLAT